MSARHVESWSPSGPAWPLVPERPKPTSPHVTYRLANHYPVDVISLAQQERQPVPGPKTSLQCVRRLLELHGRPDAKDPPFRRLRNSSASAHPRLPRRACLGLTKPEPFPRVQPLGG